MDLPIAAVMRALGVDPRSVQADSASITFQDGQPVLKYGIIVAIPLDVLARAFSEAAFPAQEMAPHSEDPDVQMPVEQIDEK